MKFWSRFTCPVTSVSAVTPSHCTVTSSCLDAAHSAPVLTCSQKSKPTAFGTTASRSGPLLASPPPPPPPLGSLTSPQPATASATIAAAVMSLRMVVLLPQGTWGSIDAAAELPAAVLVEDH